MLYRLWPKMFAFLVSISSLLTIACASTPADWRQMTSIYQVVVDRFARPDNSTTAPCDLEKYCGGTWQGLINRLDYIQGMGFDAVSLHVAVTTLLLAHESRCGSRRFQKAPRMDIMDTGRRIFTRQILFLGQQMTSKLCRRPFMIEKWHVMYSTVVTNTNKPCSTSWWT